MVVCTGNYSFTKFSNAKAKQMSPHNLLIPAIAFITGSVIGAIGTAYVLLTPPSNFVGAVTDEGKINEREKTR